MGGGEGRIRGGEGGRKLLQVKTQGPELPTDGPDHAICRLKGHNFGQEFHADIIITPNWHVLQVSTCRLWFYKVVNPPLKKADHLNLTDYRKHGVWIAIDKLSQKYEFKFCAN